MQSTLATSTTEPWTQLNALVDRMLDFDSRRADTVALLTQLAAKPDAPSAVRIAAYGAFADPVMALRHE